jgi:uncharacterized membrane protein YkoI
MRYSPLLAAMAFVVLAGPASAAPPSNAKPLSEIIQAIEAQADVSYFSEIDWDDDGYWEIDYVRRDGAKVEIEVDPLTGAIRR